MRAAIALLASLGVLNALVFGVRLDSLLGAWRLVITEGGEGPGVYAIWKALNGHPVYEWPHQPPFAISQYNTLFYHGYAALLRAAGVNSEGILIGGRVITLGFALAGCWCFAALLLRLLPHNARDASSRLTIVMVSLVLWLGSNFTAWWAMSIRPDVPAALFAVIGLAASLTALERRSRLMYALAGTAFFVAWGFKQSAVLTMGGVLFYLTVARRLWREALVLALPFAGLAALVLLAGGPAYRFSVLVAPGVGAFWPRQAALILGRVLTQNAFVWLFPLALVLWRPAAAAIRTAQIPHQHAGPLFHSIIGVSLAGGLVLAAHEGANKNHLLEAYLACGLAATRGLLLLRASPDAGLARRAVILAALLLTPMVAFPAAQLAWPNRFGVTHLAGAETLARKVALAEFIAALPKPVLVNDDVLSQPWHATGGRYPSLVIDNVWTGMARRSGLIKGEGAGALLAGDAIRSAVLGQDDALLASAGSAGMRCTPLTDCPRCDSSLVLCHR